MTRPTPRVAGIDRQGLYVGLEGLQTLREAWFKLLEHGVSGGIAISYSYYEGLLRYRHRAPEQVHFFCFRGPDEELLAICPLEKTRRRFRRVPMDAWSVPHDPDRPASAFVLAPACPAEALLPELRLWLRKIDGRRALLTLAGVEAGSPTYAAIAGSPHIIRAFSDRRILRLNTPRNADSLLEGVSRKFRQNIQRGWRLIEREGRVEYRVATRTDELELALEAFLALEATGWKGSKPSGRALILRPEVERHVRGMVSLLGARGECEIHSLWLGDRCIAALICFLGGEERHAFKIARDETYSSQSLGNLLMHRVLSFNAERADALSVNCGWEAEWLTPWHGSFTALHDFDISLGGVRGHLAAGLESLASFAVTVRSRVASTDETDKA